MRDSSQTLAKAALILGFFGIGLAIIAAYRNPATGYELSIYGGTPVLFWEGSLAALIISILVVFLQPSRRLRLVGVFLGGLSMTAIVSLPIIRGYYWLGDDDSLSHLGTAMEMSTGIRALSDSRYPIVHTIGSALFDATGLTLHHALLVVVVVFAVCFFVFVPLVVWELTGSLGATYVGFFSGLLLLPMNHLSPSLFLHPTSQAILYAPAFLFVFVRLYNRRSARHSAMFLLLATMFVLLHPQQAANLVAFVGVIAAIQIGIDVYNGHRLNRIREWVLPETTVYATVFWLWARTLPASQINLERVWETLGGNTNFARSTATRSGSLANVGGSLPEVFVKLFLVSLVYIVLTGLYLLVVARRFEELRAQPTNESVASDGGTDQLLLLTVYGGLVPVSVIFLVYIVGGISIQYFRHLGMLMVFATILGSIAIGRAMLYMSRHRSDFAVLEAIAVMFILFTFLSIAVVFPSPYFYYSSGHVTEAQMDGYETTFEYQRDSILFDDVRSPVFRYGNAIEGSSAEPEENAYYQKERHGIPDHFVNHSLRSYYDDPVYVPVTEADRVRDPVLWNGFRFNQSDFAYLEHEPGINKVQTNGGYDLYLVTPTTNRPNVSSREPSDSRYAMATLAHSTE